MAPGYDDGQSEIPGGVAGAVERVLVVGAGIAGLTVANALAHAGVDCLVLEAASRVGGRLHTVDLAGSPVDLGGSWLHHPSGNPLRRFAREAGLDCRPGDPLPTLTAFDVATGLWQSHADVEAGLTGELDGSRRRSRPSATGSGPGPRQPTGSRHSWPPPTSPVSPSVDAGQGLRASVEADAAGAAEHQSLQWLWTQDEYDDAYFGDLPEGGYAAVVDAMAAGIDVRLDWPVAQVDLTGDGVTLTSDSGADRDRFPRRGRDPARRAEERPAELHAAAPGRAPRGRTPARLRPLREGRPEVRRVPSGARRAGPTWCSSRRSRPNRRPGSSTSTRSASARSSCATPSTPPLPASSKRTGCCRRLGDRPARSRPRRAVPRTDGVRGDGWSEDPYTAGAYTHVTPGASNADLDLLGTPVAGRLLFAGEHTQSARVGYADGAMTSGIREAKRLLGTSSVTLGRVPA